MLDPALPRQPTGPAGDRPWLALPLTQGLTRNTVAMPGHQAGSRQAPHSAYGVIIPRKD